MFLDVHTKKDKIILICKKLQKHKISKSVLLPLETPEKIILKISRKFLIRKGQRIKLALYVILNIK